VDTPIQRIGLSATISPLEEVAKFLVGFRDDGEPRDCYIVDARFDKKLILELSRRLKTWFTHQPRSLMKQYTRK